MARLREATAGEHATRSGCDMVSRSTTATTAKRRKATLKMAGEREKEIIWGAWGERERGQSSGRDGVELLTWEHGTGTAKNADHLRERIRRTCGWQR